MPYDATACPLPPAVCSEGVRTHRVALFVALLFPGAMVVLDSEAMDALRPWQAMRVYTAGVWHNVALCGLCYILLACLPLLFLPAFMRGGGLMVSDHLLSPPSPSQPTHPPVCRSHLCRPSLLSTAICSQGTPSLRSMGMQ